jgi:hypothetical protein
VIKNNVIGEGDPAIQAVLPASMVNTPPVMLRPPSPSRYSTMRATPSGSTYIQAGLTKVNQHS